MSLWPLLLSASPGDSVVVAGLPDDARPAFDDVRIGGPGAGSAAPEYDHGLVLASSTTAPEVRRVVASVRPGGTVVIAVPHRPARRLHARAGAGLDPSRLHMESTLWCGEPWSNPLWSAPTAHSVVRWFAEDFAVSWSGRDVLRAELARRSRGGLGWLADGRVLVGHVPVGPRCSRC